MTIPFTQYLRPDGRKRPVTINRSLDIEDKAAQVMKLGYAFEIEELITGQVSMTVTSSEGDLIIKICDNDPSVLHTVDTLVSDAYDQIVLRREK